jgi:hypothetical protein
VADVVLVRAARGGLPIGLAKNARINEEARPLIQQAFQWRAAHLFDVSVQNLGGKSRRLRIGRHDGDTSFAVGHEVCDAQFHELGEVTAANNAANRMD